MNQSLEPLPIAWLPTAIRLSTAGSNHDESPALAGKVKWKTAPLTSADSAQSFPPCASIIVRQTERPIPNPSGFVV
jgi:hypothetical protein